MIKVILVPIDGTPRSEQVLDTAKIIAGRFNSHIKVVHVREQGAEPFLFSGVPEKMREQVAEMNAEMAGSLADEVRQQFEQFCQDNAIRITQKPSGAAEITASLHLLDGDARSMLVREARLVDVIAMPPIRWR